MNKKLIRMLQQAHAMEVGAMEAYTGHIASLPHGRIKTELRIIRLEELTHKLYVEAILQSLEAKPSPFLDRVFWLIGRTISVSCRVMPYRVAMWGAGLIEKLGSISYYRISRECNGLDKTVTYGLLLDMAIQEEEHEEFFKEVLK